MNSFYRHCGGPYCDARRKHSMRVVGRTLAGLLIMRCRCCFAQFDWHATNRPRPAGVGAADHSAQLSSRS